MRLIEMVRLYISVNRIQQKDLAQQTGINPSTLTRFFQDGSINSDSLAKLIKWALNEDTK